MATAAKAYILSWDTIRVAKVCPALTEVGSQVIAYYSSCNRFPSRRCKKTLCRISFWPRRLDLERMAQGITGMFREESANVIIALSNIVELQRWDCFGNSCNCVVYQFIKTFKMEQNKPFCSEMIAEMCKGAVNLCFVTWNSVQSCQTLDLPKMG
jgi:hypothetical protein